MRRAVPLPRGDIKDNKRRFHKASTKLMKWPHATKRIRLVLGKEKWFPSQRKYFPQQYVSEWNPTGPYSTGENHHDGQYKLLMSEIHFLTGVYNDCRLDEKFLCVYAGACPCSHLKDLTKMFPNVFYILIDPRFTRQDMLNLHRQSPGRVLIYPEMFDDRTASAIRAYTNNRDYADGSHWVTHALHKYDMFLDDIKGPNHPTFGEITSHKNLLFISDVRTDARNEFTIAEEMKSQGNWFRTMDATAGLLKFRLPYINEHDKSNEGTKSNVISLKGDVCLPIYGPQSTTECRLLVRRGCANHSYDPVQHERTMAGFNGNDRMLPYKYKGAIFPNFDRFAENVVYDNYEKMRDFQHRVQHERSMAGFNGNDRMLPYKYKGEKWK
jgi:hypothetical protein